MAISAATIWEIRAGGSDTNGGGYTSGGTDYSQQTSAQLSVSDGNAASTTNLNSATGGFTSAMVGNILQISSGTLTAGFYEITAFVDTNNVTLDRALNTGSGSTVNVGGALATTDKVDDGMVGGNICYIKSGTYTRTATWAITLSGTASNMFRFVGYDTTRTINNSDSSRPLITTATNSVQLMTMTNSRYCAFHNISFSNTAGTRGVGLGNSTTGSGLTSFTRCKFDGFSWAINITTNSANLIEPVYFTECEIANGTTGGVVRSRVAGQMVFVLNGCWIHDCAGPAYQVGSGFDSGAATVFNSIFSNNARGVYVATTGGTVSSIVIMGCSFFDNTTSAIEIDCTSGSSVASLAITNSIIWGGTDGINFTSGNDKSGRYIARNLAFGGQSGSAKVNFSAADDEVTLTADPFTNSAGDDYSLNNTSGGGADLRALGFPALFPGGLTASYSDIGAAQHQDSGGGGGSTEHSHAYIG